MPRRMSFWDDSLINLGIASGATSITVLTLTPGGQSEGFTLVRCLVHLYLAELATPSVNGGQRLSAGIGLASKEAVALGATALPDPDTNTEQPISDWVWRDRAVVLYDNTNVVPSVEWKADLRSGRKLAGGQLFLAIVNTASFGTARTINAMGLIRCLLLRP